MSLLSPGYLKEYFKAWTDDMLHDRHRELRFFDDEKNFEKIMIETESKRREEEYAQRNLVSGLGEGSNVAR